MLHSEIDACAGDRTLNFHEPPGSLDRRSGAVPQIPHLHSLVSNGVWDRQEQFQPFDPLDSEGLTRLFQHHVLEMLTSQRRLSRDFADRLRSWHPSGFQVYCGPPIDRADQSALERLSARSGASSARSFSTRISGSARRALHPRPASCPTSWRLS